MQWDPKKRPSAGDLLAHPFLNKKDDKLSKRSVKIEIKYDMNKVKEAYAKKMLTSNKNKRKGSV